jgi:uncharacterized protein YdaU (DUF1376 family)
VAQLPRMGVFTDALLGDTMDLSAEEFGAYCLILFVTWRNNGQSLEDDPARMSRIARVSERRWKAVIRPALERFFDLTDGRWRQKRLEKEYQAAADFARVQRAKSNARWASKLLKNNNTSDPPALPRDMLPVPVPVEEEKKEGRTNNSGTCVPPTFGKPRDKSRGSRIPSDWQPSPDDCQFALSLGIEPAGILEEFRDYWLGEGGQRARKVDWSRTFRNRCRQVAERRRRPGANRPGGDSFFTGLRDIGVKAGMG